MSDGLNRAKQNLRRAEKLGYLNGADLREAYALGVIHKKEYERMRKKLMEK